MESPTEAAKSTPAAEAIRLIGGPVATARKLEIDNYQTVQSWAKAGIPARYCPRVEAMTGISRKVLRPDDWQDYWPDPETEAPEQKVA